MGFSLFCPGFCLLPAYLPGTLPWFCQGFLGFFYSACCLSICLGAALVLSGFLHGFLSILSGFLPAAWVSEWGSVGFCLGFVSILPGFLPAAWVFAWGSAWGSALVLSEFLNWLLSILPWFLSAASASVFCLGGAAPVSAASFFVLLSFCLVSACISTWVKPRLWLGSTWVAARLLSWFWLGFCLISPGYARVLPKYVIPRSLHGFFLVSARFLLGFPPGLWCLRFCPWVLPRFQPRFCLDFYLSVCLAFCLVSVSFLHVLLLRFCLLLYGFF
jgi:hypothetical protein